MRSVGGVVYSIMCTMKHDVDVHTSEEYAILSITYSRHCFSLCSHCVYRAIIRRLEYSNMFVIDGWCGRGRVN